MDSGNRPGPRASGRRGVQTEPSHPEVGQWQPPRAPRFREMRGPNRAIPSRGWTVATAPGPALQGDAGSKQSHPIQKVDSGNRPGPRASGRRGVQAEPSYPEDGQWLPPQAPRFRGTLGLGWPGGLVGGLTPAVASNPAPVRPAPHPSVAQGVEAKARKGWELGEGVEWGQAGTRLLAPEGTRPPTNPHKLP
ncbi:unnamed protein product [Lepidochelys kempii]